MVVGGTYFDPGAASNGEQTPSLPLGEAKDHFPSRNTDMYGRANARSVESSQGPQACGTRKDRYMNMNMTVTP